MTFIDDIRAKFTVGLFEFSRHALDQSLRRNVTVAEVREAVAGGEVIEDYPNDKYGPSCLIFGSTTAGRPLHVQCSYPSRPLVKVITPIRARLGPVDQLSGAQAMTSGSQPRETMVNQLVTYSIDLEGRVVLIENVPARVCVETGEQFFSPQTVERIHEIIRGGNQPKRTIATPVYEFAT